MKYKIERGNSMLIIATDTKEDEILDEISSALKKRYNVTVILSNYAESFAEVRWSIKDLEELEDAKTLSEEDKMNFMEFAQEQISDRMVEYGWESMNYLLHIFLEQEKNSK